MARSQRAAGDDAERVDHEPDAVQTEDALQVDFDITVVGGEHGRRLAALQAEAVLDVLTWLHEHHRTGIATE
ncbi:hypothetical protein OHA72_01385 [Dactylosporangium sp. NBC_01737]|uniref:hypothetical protein n=1 Tax=Dactylosporangium sp. NBC_01737 TaxID=2975959 RepID=UPI002E14C32C|nr:hypothetical protein OHA72_01385 [Dactylosporangium sp. NBC_01737]